MKILHRVNRFALATEKPNCYQQINYLEFYIILIGFHVNIWIQTEHMFHDMYLL